MRAATAIVGAIAAASILIALAFLLSSGGSSGGAGTTKTVTERVEASSSELGQGSGTAETAPTHVGGPTPCNGGEFTVEGTSCEVGTKIHDQYAEGSRGELVVVGAEETITMSCEGAAPVICSGPGGAKVYFAR